MKSDNSAPWLYASHIPVCAFDYLFGSVAISNAVTRKN